MSSQNQVLHRPGIITRAARQFYTLHAPCGPDPSQAPRPIPAHPVPRWCRFNFQRIFRQAGLTLLPNPVCVDSGWVTRCRRANVGKHRQRNIEMVIGVTTPGEPQSSHNCATRTAPESVQKCGSASGISTAFSMTAWPISRQLVAIMFVATGSPVARRIPPSPRDPRSLVQLQPDLPRRSGHPQPFAQGDSLIQQPRLR